MREILLLKNGELALKGLNRSAFESVLVKNIKRRLAPLGGCELRCSQSAITLRPADESFDMDEAQRRLSVIFGLAGFSRAAEVEKDMDAVLRAAPEYLRGRLETARSFKVAARRSDKKFGLTSPEISAAVGETLLRAFPHLKVDVREPELLVAVEIRDSYAYIHAGQQKGAGGLPVGTGGRALLLLSGGIDSPVAGWMMAKRGVALTAVHFASPPFTSPQSETKVRDLLRLLVKYFGSVRLLTVPFTKIQENIRDLCPEELFTLLMRRFMMRIASRLASQQGCSALITGESLGQVASQTLPALTCTDEASALPVFRPLIGMDKEEIVAISKRIGAFDISIRPFEDCCTVFTPRHPRTRPNLEQLKEAESVLTLDTLVERAVSGVRTDVFPLEGGC